MGAIQPDTWITRGQAAILACVLPDTIGKWHARGWRTPTGQHRHLTTKSMPDGTLRYRVGDILAAERDTRRNPNSRRTHRTAYAA